MLKEEFIQRINNGERIQFSRLTVWKLDNGWLYDACLNQNCNCGSEQFYKDIDDFWNLNNSGDELETEPLGTS